MNLESAIKKNLGGQFAEKRLKANDPVQPKGMDVGHGLYARFVKAENQQNRSTSGSYQIIELYNENEGGRKVADIETKTLQKRTEDLQQRNHPMADAFEKMLRRYKDLTQPDRHEISEQRTRAILEKRRVR